MRGLGITPPAIAAVEDAYHAAVSRLESARARASAYLQETGMILISEWEADIAANNAAIDAAIAAVEEAHHVFTKRM